ncbi:hypothetical protein BMS3Abin14_01518 [bacterium BMS3Abin14]|nr:hypothetical protein BMS3Abin14_01518 [bacterium BMS3Abin14]
MIFQKVLAGEGLPRTPIDILPLPLGEGRGEGNSTRAFMRNLSAERGSGNGP